MKQLKQTTLLLALIAASFFQSMAQDLSFNINSYSWDKTPQSFTPTELDKKNATICVFMHKTVEYAFNEKGDGVELYYVTHTLKYVNDDKSIEDNNKIYVSTNEQQKLVFIKTRVISNQKVLFEASEKDFIQVTEDGKNYNMIALKGLDKGVLVETMIGYNLNADLYGEETYQSNYPIKKASFTLITPDQLKFNAKIYNAKGTITDTVYEKRRFNYTTFSDVPAFNTEEQYSLGNANKIRVEYVYAMNVVSKKKNVKWPEMGRIFFDRMNYNYEKNIKDLDKILSKINIKQYKTPEEKIFAIECFIKTNINSEPNAPDVESFADVVKLKYTYPYKINQLYTQLYRRAELNCEIVLTCEKGYKRFDPEFDSWAYLKNVLFYFPEISKFIDPNATLYRLGKISSDYVGQNGLFIKSITIGEVTSASASIKFIPVNAPEENRDYENYTATVSADLSSMDIQYNRVMNGYGEQGIRGVYFIMEEDKKRTFIEEFVKGLATESKVTEIKVSNFDINSFENTRKPLEINAKINTSHYLESAGEDKVLLKVGELIGQQMEMYQAEARINPVDIPYAHQYIRTIKINIPKGYSVKGLDKLIINHSYNNASGKVSFNFTSSYTLENNLLTIICNESYNDLVYPVSIFDDFKRVINDAADFNKISLLIEKL